MFEQEARRIALGQQNAPRQFSTSLLWWIIFDKESMIISLFGLLGVLSGIYVLFVANAGLFYLIFGVLLLMAGGFVFILPGLNALHWYRSLRFGRLFRAHVVEVNKKNRDSSFRAEQNGAVQGIWEIQIDGQYIRESFSLNQSWSNSVSVGSQVLVLAHPHKPKLWAPVGI